MRGTRRGTRPGGVVLGLIPTYAGNTAGARWRHPAGRAHPHVCGEHLFASALTIVRKGSSPRMRGTPDRVEARCPGAGLIPTYAGNTKASTTARSRSRAHPHVCGEHTQPADDSLYARGSSPRMRGTRVGHARARHANGLIPTYAGNTSSTSKRSCAVRAHPHVCGEHHPFFIAAVTYPGSSPRMRGTPPGGGSGSDRRGLIPTYAGNTDLFTHVFVLDGAHPHVCGEHVGFIAGRLLPAGSSPRMRGTRY